MNKRLSFMQHDLLKELGTIGSGHAATAMAELIGSKIMITVPTVALASFAEVASYVGGPENVLACVSLDVKGSVPGTVLILFEEESALSLLRSILWGSEPNFKNLTELEQSALNEVGNILAGSYLSALADFSEQSIMAGVPSLAIDMAAAVLSAPLTKVGSVADVALLIQAEFITKKTSSGCVVFIPQPEATDKLLKLFGVVVNE